MSIAFESHARTIGELLGPTNRSRMVVPAYQRGYSWEKKHVETFWRDLTNFRRESALKNGPDRYFLGPIVVIERKEKREIEVLDGQQRLATATALLCVIRDAADKIDTAEAKELAFEIHKWFVLKEDGGYALMLGDTDQTFFAETVQQRSPIARKASIRSRRLINEAQQYLRQCVEGLTVGKSPSDQVKELRELKTTLGSDFVMANILVESERDAFRIFETLNHRGLKLSVPDLLLNYLMRTASDDSQRKEIRGKWNEMLQLIGRRNPAVFIRHLWVSKQGDLKDRDLYSAMSNDIESKSLNSVSFARDCAAECSAYVSLFEGDAETMTEGAIPVVQSLTKKLNVQSAFPLLLSSLAKFDRQGFEKVARLVLVFVTRYSVVMDLDPSGMETVLFALAKEVRDTVTSPSEQGKCLAKIKAELSNKAPNDDQIVRAAEKLVVAESDATYLVGRIAIHLGTKTKEVTITESNLEHVYPQNPRDTEWGGLANQEVLEPFTWHLGNLTILGKRINSGAGNKDFNEKRTAYASSELNITKQIADSYTVWTPKEIEGRAKDLAKLLPVIWDFDNPSRV